MLAPTRLVDLPDALLLTVFRTLDDASLARVGCACRDLARRSSQPYVWEARCKSRWQTQTSELWEREATRRAYKQLYAAKHQLDKTARELVDKLHDVEQRPQTNLKLFQMGIDILDALKEDAQAPPKELLRRQLSSEALFHIQARRCADEMASLVYRCGSRPDGPLEEGSLLLAQCHSPLTDLSTVYSFFDELAEELRHRMAAAGVRGGEAALKLLSGLLFAPMEEQEMPDEKYGTWQGADPGERDLEPVLKRLLRVPPGGGSLNLKGNREQYGAVNNSLLPMVLLSGRGIPLSLCIIHAAVGRRAGLDIQGVNMPSHFINHFRDGEVELFVDCFNGGQIMDRNSVLLAFGPAVHARFGAGNHRLLASPRDVWIRALSNLQNAYAGLTWGHQQPPRGYSLCNLLMCGILRTFTRQPYFVNQGLVTEYVTETWADGADLLPWVLPGSLALAPRDMNESLR